MRHFPYCTNQLSLLLFKNFLEAEGLLARLLSFLETYDFEIKHGKVFCTGIQTDCLDALRADVQSLIVARTTIRCRMTRTIAQRCQIGKPLSTA